MHTLRYWGDRRLFKRLRELEHLQRETAENSLTQIAELREEITELLAESFRSSFNDELLSMGFSKADLEMQTPYQLARGLLLHCFSSKDISYGHRLLISACRYDNQESTLFLSAKEALMIRNFGDALSFILFGVFTIHAYRYYQQTSMVKDVQPNIASYDLAKVEQYLRHKQQGFIDYLFSSNNEDPMRWTRKISLILLVHNGYRPSRDAPPEPLPLFLSRGVYYLSQKNDIELLNQMFQMQYSLISAPGKKDEEQRDAFRVYLMLLISCGQAGNHQNVYYLSAYNILGFILYCYKLCQGDASAREEGQEARADRVKAFLERRIRKFIKTNDMPTWGGAFPIPKESADIHTHASGDRAVRELERFIADMAYDIVDWYKKCPQDLRLCAFELGQVADELYRIISNTCNSILSATQNGISQRNGMHLPEILSQLVSHHASPPDKTEAAVASASSGDTGIHKLRRCIGSFPLSNNLPHLCRLILKAANEAIAPALVASSAPSNINLCAFSEYQWLRAIAHPEKAFNPFAQQDAPLEALRQQFCDIYGRAPSITVLQHLRIARNLRILLRECTSLRMEERLAPRFHDLNTWCHEKTGYRLNSMNELADEDLTDALTDRGVLWDDHARVIREERDWMCRLIHQMWEEDFVGQGIWLPPCFHAYLLLMNEYCGLLIQKETQTGFDQFNNTTRIKAPLELNAHYYRECFRHFHGNHPRSNILYLDARFAPWDSIDGNLQLLTQILRGYAQYLADFRSSPFCAKELPERVEAAKERIAAAKPDELLDVIRDLLPAPGFRYLRLGLTAHFIKTSWNRQKDDAMRYPKTREYLRTRSEIIKAVLLRVPRLSEFLHSVDAANDESYVPPAVFAPCFRFCRRELGMERITFHCGECFPHLLTGLRAMNDARRLLEPGNGDRIGHGTALGMDPTFWREHQGNAVYLRLEDRMLDLLYAHEILKQERCIPGQTCARLEEELMTLAHQIFCTKGRHIDTHILKAAMDMRGLCPFHLKQIFTVGGPTSPASHGAPTLEEHIERFKKGTAAFLRERGIGIWEKGADIGLIETNNELEYTIRALKNAPSHAIMLLLDWQFDSHTWETGKKIIRVELNKEDDEILLTLQRRMMQDYVDAKIVIETLISSNLRIACYRRAAEHHAMRWLLRQPEKFKGEPDLLLCFGSDDPAIFSCDAKADFYLLYASLHEHGIKEQQAIQLLDCVNRRGRIYSFPPPRDPLTPEEEREALWEGN